MTALNNSLPSADKPAHALVSVLIRTRNRRDLLLEALQSVMQQTWPAIEIIIVNDGGEDYENNLPSATVQPLRTLRWIQNVAGQGRSAAGNTALNVATGEYCVFLDDDDWFDAS